MGCASSQPSRPSADAPGTLLGRDNLQSIQSVKQLQVKNVKEGCVSRLRFIAENTGNINDYYTFDKKRLGEGAFGTVRICTHKTSKVVRACKTIRKQGVKDNRSFIAEIALMKGMDHPHIVKLYESFEDGLNYYLTMELCTGGELFDRLVDLDAGFTEKDTAILTRQMLHSVLYMHSQRICHRDLKPENYLLHAKGELKDSVLKLIDFGLASPFRENKFTTMVGSAFYMAPEVIAKKYSHECDIWSVGCIVYVMMCGYPPFQGDNDSETLTLVKSGKLTFPEEEWDMISADGKDLVKKLLTRKVPDRATLNQALDHDWVKHLAPRSSGHSLAANLVRNMQEYQGHHHLKKAALHVIAANLGEKEIASLRDTFKALDDNGDGLLSAEELMNGIKTANFDGFSVEDVKQMMESVDCDASGFIDYTEFLAAALEKRLYDQESVLWEAFSVFDRDGDGKISRDELRAVLSDESLENANIANAKELDAMLDEVDANGDGEIDFQEFVAMMRTGAS